MQKVARPTIAESPHERQPSTAAAAELSASDAPPPLSTAAMRDSDSRRTLGSGAVVELAALSSRLGARLIDCGIFFAMFLAACGVVAVVAVYVGAVVAGLVIAVVVLPLPLAFLYEVWPTAVSGQTIGKRLVGVKVVASGEGGPPGWAGSSLRWLIPAVLSALSSGLFGLVAYLWCLWDADRQGLHDKAAGTIVVKAL